MNFVKNKDLTPEFSISGLNAALCFILMITVLILYQPAASSQNPTTSIIGEEVFAALAQNSEVTVVVSLFPPQVSIYEISRYCSAIAFLQESVLDGLNPADYIVIHRFKSVPGLALRVKSADVLYQLALRSAVRRIDLDVGGRGGLDDSRYLVNADQAHSDGFTGSGSIVAVLDSGIDSDHPNLADALIDEHCFCYKPSGGCCPDGNNEQSGTGSAEDDHGHGTHVTGIITGDGNTAPLGIAPEVKIVAVKVLDSNNSFHSSSDIVAALDWIFYNRPDVDVVNMSLFTYAKFSDVCDETYSWTQALASAINNLRSIGILCVAIAGNDSLVGQIVAPGCISNCMAVGASNKNDYAASFSNSHELVDLFAPGVSIVSTGIDGGSKSMSGTSMAAPHVSATAAILKQKEPNLRPDDMESALETSPVDISDRAGLTRPRLDVAAALDAIITKFTISGQVTFNSEAVNVTDSMTIFSNDANNIIKISKKDQLSRSDLKPGKKAGMKVSEGLSGVVMEGLPDNPVTDTSGNYSVQVDQEWSGTVTPTKTGYTFNPSTSSYSNVTSDQTNQNYTASIIQYTLNISAGTGGTTNPSPWSYTYNSGTEVNITATPDIEYRFTVWTGDVPQGHESDNPLTMTMDSDKSVTAHFKTTGGDGPLEGEGGGCFIATAAYGSPSHPYVRILQDFRDKYLMPNKIGRRFVHFYYKYSPFVTDIIVRHKLLKAAVWVILLPLVAFSFSILHFGLPNTAFMLVFILVLQIVFILILGEK